MTRSELTLAARALREGWLTEGKRAALMASIETIAADPSVNPRRRLSAARALAAAARAAEPVHSPR
jgi:hypothetical protein